MSKFLIMPEGCKWYEVERPVKDLESVYRMECSFFTPSTRVCIRDVNSGAVEIFSRSLESNGNIKEVNRL